MNVHILNKEAARVVSAKQHKYDKTSYHIVRLVKKKRENFIKITIHCFKTFNHKIKITLQIHER